MRITELIDDHGIPLAVLLAQYPAAKRCETPSLELLVSALSAIRNALTSRLRSALLLKPVAASAVDRVCRFSANVFVQSRLIARAVTKGEPLPAWRGCRTLRGSELFLLAEHPASFDSRYFGPVHARHVIGTAIPLWSKDTDNNKIRPHSSIGNRTPIELTKKSTARVPDDENWRFFSLRLPQKTRARWYVVRRI